MTVLSWGLIVLLTYAGIVTLVLSDRLSSGSDAVVGMAGAGLLAGAILNTVAHYVLPLYLFQ